MNSWERYKLFEEALFEELDSEFWGKIDWDGEDKSDFKDCLRTAWEKSEGA